MRETAACRAKPRWHRTHPQAPHCGLGGPPRAALLIHIIIINAHGVPCGRFGAQGEGTHGQPTRPSRSRRTRESRTLSRPLTMHAARGSHQSAPAPCPLPIEGSTAHLHLTHFPPPCPPSRPAHGRRTASRWSWPRGRTKTEGAAEFAAEGRRLLHASETPPPHGVLQPARPYGASHGALPEQGLAQGGHPLQLGGVVQQGDKGCGSMAERGGGSMQVNEKEPRLGFSNTTNQESRRHTKPSQQKDGRAWLVTAAPGW
jgi:hypothetical protein